jgi:hypothetical protein
MRQGQRGLGFLTDAQLRAQMEEVAAAGMQVRCTRSATPPTSNC